MNINGHEVEVVERDSSDVFDDDTWYLVDGAREWRTSTSIETIQRVIDAKRQTVEQKIARAEAVIEYKRREAAEKAEQAAANELDRRADLARMAWFGHRGKNNALPWHLVAGDAQEDWRNLVRALDADAATRQPDQAGEPS